MQCWANIVSVQTNYSLKQVHPHSKANDGPTLANTTCKYVI